MPGLNRRPVPLFLTQPLLLYSTLLKYLFFLILSPPAAAIVAALFIYANFYAPLKFVVFFLSFLYCASHISRSRRRSSWSFDWFVWQNLFRPPFKITCCCHRRRLQTRIQRERQTQTFRVKSEKKKRNECEVHTVPKKSKKEVCCFVVFALLWYHFVPARRRRDFFWNFVLVFLKNLIVLFEVSWFRCYTKRERILHTWTTLITL